MVQPWGGKVNFALETGGPQLTDFTLLAGNSYINPALDAVNFELTDGYVPPSLTLIEFLLSPEHICPPYEPPVGNSVLVELKTGYTVPSPTSITVVLDPCDGVEPPPVEINRLYLSIESVWGRTLPRSVNPIQSVYGSVPKLEIALSLPYNPGTPQDPVIPSGWNTTPRKDVDRGTSWNEGLGQDSKLFLEWNKVLPHDVSPDLSWEPSTPVLMEFFGVDWNKVYPYDRLVLSSWNRANLPGIYVDPPPYIVESNANGIVLPRGSNVNFLLKNQLIGSPANIVLKPDVIIRKKDPEQSINFYLELGDNDGNIVLTGRAAYIIPAPTGVNATLSPLYTAPSGLAVNATLGTTGSTVEVIDPPPYVQQRTDPFFWSMPWGTVPTKDTRLLLPWGAGHYGGRDPIIDGPWVNDPGPPPTPPPVSPTLPVYIVMNSISVVMLPGLEPLHVTGFSISGSEDGSFWMFRGELSNPNQIPLIQKDSNGPKEIQVTINGHIWTFIVEDYDDDRTFNDRRASFNGRSRTALLSDPYAPRRSFVNESPFTIQQLIARELENTGFTLDFQAVDWVVPAGGWFYQDLTPMEAILRLAEASGSVVQSDPRLKQIKVAPRYPVSPWSWTEATLDAAINEHQIQSLNFQNKTLPLYDYVLVSGETQGVSDVIQRTGSGGEIRAPMVVDQLILDHPGAQERGRNILSDRGEQGLFTVTLQLFPPETAPGRILPLHLVEVQESVPWIGKCTSTEVTVNTAGDGTLEVWMSNLLERHYSDAN